MSHAQKKQTLIPNNQVKTFELSASLGKKLIPHKKQVYFSMLGP